MDDIHPANRRVDGGDRDQDAGKVEAGLAIVADHHILVGTASDLVGTETTDDAVASAAHRNDVVAADRRVRAVDASQQTHPTHVDECRGTIVAEDHVGVVATRDAIRSVAAEHGIETIAGDDHIIVAASQRCIRSRDRDQNPCGVKGRAAVVADHHITASTTGDLIAANATDDRIVANTDINDIDPTDRRGGRGDANQDSGSIEGGRTIVSKHHIAVVATGDLIGPKAAKHHIRSVAAGDDVVATDPGVRRSDFGE